MEEKTMVFNEIMPKALTLMTDVFGNYVVQKVILFLTFELYNVLLLCLNGYQIHYIRKKTSILILCMPNLL